MFYVAAILFPPLQSLPVKRRNMNVLALPVLISSQHILISRFPFILLGFVYIFSNLFVLRTIQFERKSIIWH